MRNDHDSLKLVAGLFLVFALFHWSATALGSDRGQAGLLVGALVVAATLAVERLFFGRPVATAARTLGLGAPALRGVATAAALGLALLLVIPVFARVTQSSVTTYPGWISLLPGLFAQAGIAEETLFRGYLFGHLRRGRSFWRAATLATVPFTLVHLILFATMSWELALASVLLAVVISFPLAYLYELGGRTIWAPALVHFVVQGALKVVVVSGGASGSLPLVWMAASAVLPYLVFLVPRTGGDFARE